MIEHTILYRSPFNFPNSFPAPLSNPDYNNIVNCDPELSHSCEKGTRDRPEVSETREIREHVGEMKK